MPLISVAMHEDHDIGQNSVVIYNVTISPLEIMIYMCLLCRTHVKYTIASRPLFIGTVYCAMASSTTYRIIFQSGIFWSIQVVLSFCILATTSTLVARGGVETSLTIGRLSCGVRDEDALKKRPITTNVTTANSIRWNFLRLDSVKPSISSLMTDIDTTFRRFFERLMKCKRWDKVYGHLNILR